MVEDVSRAAPTIADLMDRRSAERSRASALFSLDELCALPARTLPRAGRPAGVKAAGVTFAVSAIERVIEERARGDAAQAAAIRDSSRQRIGGGIRSVVPGLPRRGAAQGRR